MISNSITSSFDNVDLNSDTAWTDLYPLLRSIARHLVYSFHLSSWRGQENDIVDDIVQETARRLIERAHKAERGEADPIYSLRQMITVIAQNYCKDLWRSECRLSRISQDQSPETFIGAEEQAGTLNSATENVYQELIFKTAAHEIASFPAKQRKAVLTDLANRMHFDKQPTPLQKAFLKEGIQLKHYQQPLPADSRERSRHASILSYAYQRIAHLPSVRAYVSVA